MGDNEQTTLLWDMQNQVPETVPLSQVDAKIKAGTHQAYEHTTVEQETTPGSGVTSAYGVDQAQYRTKAIGSQQALQGAADRANELVDKQQKESFDNFSDAMEAFKANYVKGMSLGFIDPTAEGHFASPLQARERQLAEEEHPWASKGGAAAAVAVTLLPTGGESALALGGAKALRLASAAEKAVIATPLGAVIKAQEAVTNLIRTKAIAAGAKPGLITSAATEAAGGAVGGAMFGAAQQVGNAINGRQVSGDAIIDDIGLNTALSGGLGLAGGAFGKVAARIKAGKQEVVSAARLDELVDNVHGAVNEAAGSLQLSHADSARRLNELNLMAKEGKLDAEISGGEWLSERNKLGGSVNKAKDRFLKTAGVKDFDNAIGRIKTVLSSGDAKEIERIAIAYGDYERSVVNFEQAMRPTQVDYDHLLTVDALQELDMRMPAKDHVYQALGDLIEKGGSDADILHYIKNNDLEADFGPGQLDNGNIRNSATEAVTGAKKTPQKAVSAQAEVPASLGKRSARPQEQHYGSFDTGDLDSPGMPHQVPKTQDAAVGAKITDIETVPFNQRGKFPLPEDVPIPGLPGEYGKATDIEAVPAGSKVPRPEDVKIPPLPTQEEKLLKQLQATLDDLHMKKAGPTDVTPVPEAKIGSHRTTAENVVSKRATDIEDVPLGSIQTPEPGPRLTTQQDLVPHGKAVGDELRIAQEAVHKAQKLHKEAEAAAFKAQKIAQKAEERAKGAANKTDQEAVPRGAVSGAAQVEAQRVAKEAKAAADKATKEAQKAMDAAQEVRKPGRAEYKASQAQKSAFKAHQTLNEGKFAGAHHIATATSQHIDSVAKRLVESTNGRLGTEQAKELARLMKINMSRVSEAGPIAEQLINAWSLKKLAESVGGVAGKSGKAAQASMAAKAMRAGVVSQTRRMLPGGFIGGAAGYAMGGAVGGLIGASGSLAAVAGRMKTAATMGLAKALNPVGRKLISFNALGPANISYDGTEPTRDFDKKAAQLRQLVASPAALKQKADDAVADISMVDPYAAGNAAESIVRRTKNLANHIPEGTFRGPLVPPGPPDQMQLDNFHAYEQITHDREAVFQYIKAGSMPEAVIEAVREQHPDFLLELKQYVVEHPEEVMNAPHPTKIALSALLGINLTQEADPLYVQRQQQAYIKQKEDAQKAKMAQQGASMMRGGMPAPLPMTPAGQFTNLQGLK